MAVEEVLLIYNDCVLLARSRWPARRRPLGVRSLCYALSDRFGSVNSRVAVMLHVTIQHFSLSATESISLN